MGKTKLNPRIETSVVQRLLLLQAAEKIPLSALIERALDAYEREQNLPAAVPDLISEMGSRVELLTETLGGLEEEIEETTTVRITRLLEDLSGKIDRAEANDNDRLRALWSHVKDELDRRDAGLMTKIEEACKRRFF